MGPMQQLYRYGVFPAAVAGASYLYTSIHDKAVNAVPSVKKIPPFTPAWQGAGVTGAIALVSNIVFIAAPVMKVATTVVGIGSLAFGLHTYEQQRVRESFQRQMQRQSREDS